MHTGSVIVVIVYAILILAIILLACCCACKSCWGVTEFPVNVRPGDNCRKPWIGSSSNNNNNFISGGFNKGYGGHGSFGVASYNDDNADNFKGSRGLRGSRGVKGSGSDAPYNSVPYGAKPRGLANESAPYDDEPRGRTKGSAPYGDDDDTTRSDSEGGDANYESSKSQMRPRDAPALRRSNSRTRSASPNSRTRSASPNSDGGDANYESSDPRHSNTRPSKSDSRGSY